MEEENKTSNESSIVFKKSIEKREEESHKATQVDEKNDILVDLPQNGKRNDQKTRRNTREKKE